MPKKTAPLIELFRTDAYYIFQNGEHSLWWNRVTGQCEAKSGWDLASAINPECLGVLYGIVGKVELQPALPGRLMLIRQCEYVGELPGGHSVFKIKAVSFLPLLGPDTTTSELGLEPCTKHQNRRVGDKGSGTGGMFDMHQKAAFAKTWGTIKSATNTIKTTTQQAAALATSQVKPGKKRDTKENERFERRIIEELHKIISETDSFYFSLTGDLTNSLQRQWKRQQQLAQQQEQAQKNIEPWTSPPLWKLVDNRYFWNVHMLNDIILLNDPRADPWLMPVIQGFIQIEHCKVDIGCDRRREAMEPTYETFILTLISRRSRFRAGTRYKRRGVDESGKCANYVETEQIISYHQHQVSFVQVRGSIPVYWSQPGYKYRPPPRLDRDAAVTQIAFEKHFHEELSIYGPVCIISLVEQTGREKIVGEAYADHVIGFNCPDLTYVTFDFHEYCRGMHFENVSFLVSQLLEVVNDLRFCWLDREGLICMQNGVFRVNCIDCLDRTNVVQTALAKTVMEIVFTKLGLIAPEGALPSNIRNTFQLLWANNGDTISRQYAGTNALKGDYTRTGERKFTGLMKDGMNSANRYYLSRFKDMYRQATIDLMLGNPVAEEVFCPERSETDSEDMNATAEHVKILIEDCKKLLVSESEVVLGAWGLIDADPVTGDPSETEMDTILILTRDSYYAACYDDETDRVTNYQRVLLEDLACIELGADQSSGSLFKSAKLGSGCCIRLNYKLKGELGYFHMFRSTNLRFFNNMAVAIRTEEEIVESMKAVLEAFSAAMEIQNLTVPVQQGNRLEKRKSKVPPNTEGGPRRSYLDISTLPQMTRNVSENQLLALKSVGTKAISNVTQQFNKLNKLTLRSGFNTKKVPDQEKSHGEIEALEITKENKPIFSIGTACESHEEVEFPLKELLKVKELSTLTDKLRHPNCDIVLASCGIVAGHINVPSHTKSHSNFMESLALSHAGQPEGSSENETRVDFLLPPTRGLTYSRSDLSLSESASANLQPIASPSLTPSPHRALTPEITVDAAPPSATTTTTEQHPPLAEIRQLSHSSGEVDKRFAGTSAAASTKKLGGGATFLTGRHPGEGSRFASERDLSINITSSQSESALKSLRGGFTSVLTSPSSTKDIVLSPLTRLAKGVQNLGANLDPRKLKQGKIPNPEALEEYRKQQEKWKHCKSRLIAL